MIIPQTCSTDKGRVRKLLWLYFSLPHHFSAIWILAFLIDETLVIEQWLLIPTFVWTVNKELTQTGVLH